MGSVKKKFYTKRVPYVRRANPTPRLHITDACTRTATPKLPIYSQADLFLYKNSRINFQSNVHVYVFIHRFDSKQIKGPKKISYRYERLRLSILQTSL